ncbi:MAG: 4-hydroxy-3-methylbut-2-en-yl diphosphate synthase [Crocinitomicaceae bacterium]|jgi:(E)-4-hydroxy-3-methylbut-2-enyl-diphosphate synthase|nr:4-hydroxy-3-methylbut-2-en-yl diphosphate synthase [Crocinitomicaceae bacterium]
MKSKVSHPYCEDFFVRERNKTIEVHVGNLKLGAENPIRVQSMTTTDTMDTEASVAQSIRMIDAGCELVRLTAPSKNEAENMGEIKRILNEKGYHAPLVADIHFTPNAAEIAARLIEKVRVNPGNYADKKKFEEIEYTDESYRQELLRIEQKFTPLIKICKENRTAMRIGTNHGSLSDRILSRFGDTPEGMVESAMEFLRICVKNDFHELVISMKASNTLVMVQAYRLLISTMKAENMYFPLHLGVTEAGDGEDGRIKSAVGIGALLEDGIGDTIRVSLTEDPEFEIPVAKKLVEKFENQSNIKLVQKGLNISYNPFEYKKRETSSVHNIGGKNHPIVFADLSQKNEIKAANFFGFGYNYSMQLDKWNLRDQAADYLYLGNNELDFEIPGTLGAVFNAELWEEKYKNQAHCYPVFNKFSIDKCDTAGLDLYFLELDLEEDTFDLITKHSKAILVVTTFYDNKAQLLRKFRCELDERQIHNPVIIRLEYETTDLERFQLNASSDFGVHLIDGFGDGVWIKGPHSLVDINSLSFGILQATRTRISKTEYISCPSCGRTLFDLQETTAKIRQKTSHLKGIKIGIMGCIVNGPGEMADADYGYVGTGPGKINLYKEKTVVRKNVNEEEAVDALIDLIKENGDWVELSATDA